MGRLKDKLAQVLAGHRQELQNLLKSSGTKAVDQVTAEQIFSGARGIHSLLCDTSSVPPDKGLIIRGHPIAELTELFPEEIFYLLLTGEIPDKADVEEIRGEFSRRAAVPDYVWHVLDALPADSHPMCMLNTAILSMQRDSVFARKYEEGMPKDQYWEATLEDALNIIARMPAIAAWVYRKRFKKGPRLDGDASLDWAANYAHLLSVADMKGGFPSLMRLYMVLHCDHESGNVSAMTAATVNSALSDLYYSLSAGLNGLAGPLHGLANQECLTWLMETMKKYGGVPTVEQITRDAEETIAAKRVVPGYGHAVLRVTDPRFSAFVEFGKAHCADDPIFKSVLNVYEAVPKVLKKYPKIKNPWPNVDAASGALLAHYGLTEQRYYTVLFAVSRSLGICAQAILARGLGQPIIRPTSVTTSWLKKACS
ncbi:MAG: citrate (Si)-synthase [Planctomycetes bacterium]|nr:citrate (Si)-synthase [Planctomycetota bacterium]